MTLSSRHHICNLSPEEIIKMSESFAFIKEIEFDDSRGWEGNPSTKMEDITAISNNCKSLQKLVLKAIDKFSYRNVMKVIELLPSISWTFDKRNCRFIGYKSNGSN